MRHSVILALVCWLILPGLPAAAQTLDIRGAIAAPGAGPAFPADAAAVAVALPDEWARTRPGYSGALWYRVSFQPGAEIGRGEPLALYVAPVSYTHLTLPTNREV